MCYQIDLSSKSKEHNTWRFFYSSTKLKKIFMIIQNYFSFFFSFQTFTLNSKKLKKKRCLLPENAIIPHWGDRKLWMANISFLVYLIFGFWISIFRVFIGVNWFINIPSKSQKVKRSQLRLLINKVYICGYKIFIVNRWTTNLW